LERFVMKSRWILDGTINPFDCYATANFRVRDFGRARDCNSTSRPVYAK